MIILLFLSISSISSCVRFAEIDVDDTLNFTVFIFLSIFYGLSLLLKTFFSIFLHIAAAIVILLMVLMTFLNNENMNFYENKGKKDKEGEEESEILKRRVSEIKINENLDTFDIH